MLRHLPNFLTLARILLCPVVVFFISTQKFSTAVILFCISTMTDMLDGFMARRLHAATNFGSYLDPLADKLTIFGFFVALMFLGLCPAWFVGFYIAVALLLSIGFLFFHPLSNETKSHFTPLWIGKWNTAFQVGWIGTLLFYLAYYKGSVPGFLALANPAVFGILTAVQGGVFLCYFFHYRVHLTTEARTFFPLHS